MMHSRFVKLGTRLITKNGRSLVLVSQQRTGKDWDPTLTEVGAPVIGVQTLSDKVEVNGQVIKQSSMYFLLDSKVRPMNSMRLRDYGYANTMIPLGEWTTEVHAFGQLVEGDAEPIDYSVIGVKEIKPGETSIIYKVEVAV